MTHYFFDTSALVKRYHPEAGTPTIAAIFADPDATIRISRLSLVECVSAFCLKIRSGAIPHDRLAEVRRFVWADTKQRIVLVTPLLRRHLNMAEQLLMRHGATHRLRALDAIQLGAAIKLFQEQKIDVFVSSDGVQCTVAQLEGLPAINPLTSSP